MLRLWVQVDASRRQVALSSIAAAGALLVSRPANAQLLGRGRDSGDSLADYKKYTVGTQAPRLPHKLCPCSMLP